jgi:hypothetical protein
MRETRNPGSETDRSTEMKRTWKSEPNLMVEEVPVGHFLMLAGFHRTKTCGHRHRTYDKAAKCAATRRYATRILEISDELSAVVGEWS